MIAASASRSLLLAILVLTLLTNVTKALFGGTANLVVDLVFLLAVILLAYQEPIRFSRAVVLFVVYVIAHAIGQLLTHGGFLSGNNYTDYRNFVRGGVIVLLLLNTNFRSEHELHSFFARVITVVAALAAADIVIESVMYHVGRVDLRDLFYVEAAYRGTESGPVYGDPTSRSRIPTLLGAPHFLGLTQASLAFVMWHLQQRSLVPRFAFWVTVATVLLAQSRLQVLVMAGAFVVYYMRGFRFTRRRVFGLGMSAVAAVLVFARFGDAIVPTHHADFKLALEVYRTYGSLDVFRELVYWPRAGELHKIVFGVGGVTGSEQYNNIISLAQIEIGLITELIPKYGLVFVAFYYAVLVTAFRPLWRSGYQRLALALLPFMASPSHMWLVNSTFVSDIFFTVIAYCILVGLTVQGRLVRSRTRIPGAPERAHAW